MAAWTQAAAHGHGEAGGVLLPWRGEGMGGYTFAVGGEGVRGLYLDRGGWDVQGFIPWQSRPQTLTHPMLFEID